MTILHLLLVSDQGESESLSANFVKQEDLHLAGFFWSTDYVAFFRHLKVK